MQVFASFLRITLTLLSILGLASIALGQDAVMDFEAQMIAETLQLRKNSEPTVVTNEVVERSGNVETRLIELELAPLGRIRMKTKGPAAPGRYPVVFLATGLQAGMETLGLINTEFPVILAAFDYPISKDMPPEQMVPHVVRGLASLQAQMAVALAWLGRQPNVREDRVSLLTVSFGTFATPLALRLAQLVGFRAYATVFAFGGAEVMPVLEKDLANLGAVLSPADMKNLTSAVSEAADFIEPKRHLKFLQTRSLVVQGLKDEVIPARSTVALMSSLPQPKALRTLDCGHINMDRRDIIDETAKVVLTWLKKQGALD